jgi:dihydrofolate synthase/folylpolyglutamate synthase
VFKDYKQTLDYLFARLPMFTRIGAAAYKADLSNTVELCNQLGNPQHHFKTIHIAGTNGKGSTSHMLASILQSGGYKTGLYTSPHLKDFRERIRINGEMISEKEVIDFVNDYKEVFEPINPSFFEWTVGLAFHIFNQYQVDIAVVETGLGGRLDSTNIISPELSIITNIGWDHMDLLGDTLEKIAGEKAGIIKHQIPVVIGEKQPETEMVFIKKSNEMDAPIFFAEAEVKIKNFHTNTDATAECDIELSNATTLEKLHLQLGGFYQQKNVATVLAAVLQLQKKGFQITESHIRKGMSEVITQTGLLGRWQKLADNPMIICDTAHNVNGIELVMKQIQSQQFEKLHMVIGMVKDKDIDKVLSLMPSSATYYFCKANLPRALPSVELANKAAMHQLHGQSYPSVSEALNAAKRQAGTNDLIFVGGSTFVVAEIC